jgi:hypothetical protein
MVNQEPNQETLFLVGSWLRPEDFGTSTPKKACDSLSVLGTLMGTISIFWKFIENFPDFDIFGCIVSTFKKPYSGTICYQPYVLKLLPYILALVCIWLILLI